ncbi:MAG: XrtA/PEP-CTERM system amidotransferase [Alphaproteobacteria bacterium]
MCGIVGIFDMRGTREINRGLLSRMNDAMTHRGPDGSGLHVEPGVGLGHRRLSIIDLEGGRQPLYNEDDSVVVVFNGEIYNFQGLVTELAAKGHVFRTHSDTEVIVHGWEEWGEACVDRFRGMFAFALWDRKRETLFLARDRLGKKPFYYAHTPDGHFVFGSELKALLPFPGIDRRLDETAVEDYFAYGYVPDPKTIYRAVAKLAPAHTMTLKRGQPMGRPRRYWDVSFHTVRNESEDELRDELIERLREAVKLRLISDVPLGAFLSGGVDSSAVVAVMAGLSDGPVETCSIAFDNPAYDESRYAKAVAERYGTRHHVSEVRADAFDLVDKLAAIYDEPFADSSAIPTYRVCKIARQHVTVALSGDGGDEVFAGYRRYRWSGYEERIRGLMPLAIRRPLFGTLGRLYPKLDWAPKVLRAKSTFESLGRDAAEGYFHSVSVLGDGLRQRLFSDAFRRNLQGYRAVDTLRGLMDRAPADDPIARIQYADIHTYLPGDILTKVDRASMANSLEVRVPMLDSQFVEWAAGLPLSARLNGREGKYLLKKSMEPFLPHDVLYRDKMGFAVPIGAWFRGPLRDRVRAAVTGPTLADVGIFDMEFLTTMVDQHQSGAREHSPALWALLMFESFLRQSNESRAAPVAADEPPARLARLAE